MVGYRCKFHHSCLSSCIFLQEDNVDLFPMHIIFSPGVPEIKLMTAYFSELEFGPSADTKVSFPQEIFIKILNYADLFLREYK